MRASEDGPPSSVDIGRRDQKRAGERPKIVIREDLFELTLEAVDREEAACEISGALQLLKIRHAEHGAERETRLPPCALIEGAEPIDDILCAIALGIERADERAGRGTDEDIDVDIKLFKRS